MINEHALEKYKLLNYLLIILTSLGNIYTPSDFHSLLQ